MSGMKDKQSGDYAPSRAPYQDFGRFRVVVNHATGQVWIRDMESSDLGNPYPISKYEAALSEFIAKEF